MDEDLSGYGTGGTGLSSLVAPQPQPQKKPGFGMRFVNALANPNVMQGGKGNIGEFVRGFTDSGAAGLQQQREIASATGQNQLTAARMTHSFASDPANREAFMNHILGLSEQHLQEAQA